MKKILLYAFLFSIIACKKEIAPSDLKINTSAGSQLTKTANDTYLPLTKKTYWQYDVVTNSDDPETSVLTVLGLQTVINNKTYEKVKVVQGHDTDTIYYAISGDNYYIYTNQGTSDDQTVSLEILFLNDVRPVGYQWQIPAGTANGSRVNCFGKILEKNITLNISGIVYRNVIHTQVQIRIPLLFGAYITVDTQEFYTAEGIGIIKNISNITLPEHSTSTTKITGYKYIKCDYESCINEMHQRNDAFHSAE